MCVLGEKCVCECVRQGQTEWPCLCIFAASRVQDGGCHQLWSSSRNNQQQLQQRGSSASGVSGGGVCYIVCMCFCFGHLFLFVGYIKLGVKLIIPPNEIRRLDKKQNVFFSKEIKCREFASLWSSVCWLSCKFVSSKTKNWKTKFKRGEIGWNAIRHRLLPPSLIPLKSYFRRIFFRQVIKNKRKEKFRFLNHRKMFQMVYILNQVCKYLYLSAILCVEKKCFHFPIVILSLCVADFRYTHTNSLRLLLLYTQTSYTHKLSS